MPRTRHPLGALLAAAAVGLLPLLVAVGTGTAAAEPSPTPSPTCRLLCPVPSSSPSPESTSDPTPSDEPSSGSPRATASASPSASRTAAPTTTTTRSPAPRRTRSDPGTAWVPAGTSGSEQPVTGRMQLSGVTPEPAAPTPAIDADDRASTSHAGRDLSRLAVLVLGAALLLGVSGATGLYLTRHRHGQH